MDQPGSPASSDHDAASKIARLETIDVDSVMHDSSREDYDIDGTYSVTNSVYEYRVENGRTYHRYRDGVYLLPNDEQEKERLDIMHNIFYLLLSERLHLAPISNPRRIIDLGCGTGIWGIMMADVHPTAQVFGLDLSPIQPIDVPANFYAQVDDIESEWTFPPDYFDYMFSRHLCDSITDWERYLAQMFKHCAPGGWIELSEYPHDLHSDDGSLKKDMALWKWFNYFNIAITRSGRDPDVALKLPGMVKKAGFVDVQVKMVKMPWAPWPKDKKLKELGQWNLLALSNGAFEAYGMAAFTRIFGMSGDEARQLCADAESDSWDRKVHAYQLHIIVTGRKPGLETA